VDTQGYFTREQLAALLSAIIREIQELTGEEAQEITDATKPVGGLKGFDSLCAVSATTELAEKLKIEQIDHRLFWSKVNGKPISIKEIVDLLCQFASRGEEKV
jgi:acyl carrier protein